MMMVINDHEDVYDNFDDYDILTFDNICSAGLYYIDCLLSISAIGWFHSSD